MKVKLLLFAVLRDILGADERTLQLAEGTTAQQVWSDLRNEHHELAAIERPPMTAINMNYVEPTSVLEDGDELAFIPPVAGG